MATDTEIQDDEDRYEAASQERFGGQNDDDSNEEGQKEPENEWKSKFEDKNRAHMAERRKRQEAERKRIELEERLDALERASKRGSAPSNDEVDEEEDPIGAIKYLKAELKRYQQQEAEENKKAETQSKQDRENKAFTDQLAELERDFMEEVGADEYNKAAKHFAETLAHELEEAGTEKADLKEALNEEIKKVARRALNAGKNPAEVIYKLAKKRGFGLDKPNQKLDMIAEGQKAGRSPSSAPSKPAAKELSWAYVASMPKGPERDKAWQKLRAQERARA